MKDKILSKTRLITEPEEFLDDLKEMGCAELLDNNAVIEYYQKSLYPYELFSLYVNVTKDLKIEFEPIVVISSRELITNYMKKCNNLTYEYLNFEETECGFNWTECDKKFGEKYDLRYLYTENTYNFDDAYWLGTVFQYSLFLADESDDEEIAIIRWHLGGDVRINYDLPEIYIGNFTAFIHDQQSEWRGYEHIKYMFDEDWDTITEVITDYLKKLLAG